MLLIGMTPSGMTEMDLTIHHDYMEAVLRAGALPVMLPLTQDAQVLHAALNAVDGVVVTGGVDVHPRMYGEEVLPCCGTIIEARDAMETIVVQYALEKDLPLLCICRGMQLCNCVLGGSLYQDIPTQYGKDLLHSRSDTPNDPVHEASVYEGTLLHSIVHTDTMHINSRHHQAVKKLAPGAVLCATAPDGLVEAFEIPGKTFALAVQWHPESLSDRYPDAQLIFNAFTKACAERKK